MQIEQYILSLLSVNQCVVVPGLGAFVKKTKGSKVVPDQEQFLSPSVHIVFNVKLKEEDGLLTHYMANKEGMAFHVAQSQMKQFVSSLKASLASGEVVMLPGIGFLSQQESRIHFVAQKHQDKSIFSETYGMPSLPLASFSYPAVQESHSSTPSGFTMKDWWKYAAVLLFLINFTLILGIIQPVLKQSIQRASMHVFSMNSEKGVYEPRKAFDLNSSVENIRSVDSFSETSYKLVVGCFKEEENAQNMLYAKEYQNFSSFYIYHDDLFKVCIFTSSDKEEVVKIREYVKSTYGISSWVLQ